ncbi:Uncharacterized protein ChrSV_4555 [Chromobacterium vaccinii]|nr:Uncharacterized protein ChrSW_4555 [Chromobacterium vaccinii]QND92011.1 Uncharacterized protein ChrSV_4555 [Chromobacterium vaccinii]
MMIALPGVNSLPHESGKLRRAAKLRSVAMSIFSIQPSHQTVERVPILERVRAVFTGLKRADARAEAPLVPGKLDLGNITVAEGRAAICALLKAGRINREESRSLKLAMDVRMLNIRYGDPIPERFDLMAEACRAMESGKNMGCWDQVQSLAHGLEVMQAYQLEAESV